MIYILCLLYKLEQTLKFPVQVALIEILQYMRLELQPEKYLSMHFLLFT